mmetsp:Transcript_3954/g.8539  ORF Transcript_3954/g.8539 Transcript_3954/m.8539 type:complete len:235 (+) Transcript_3954:239-943(+)
MTVAWALSLLFEAEASARASRWSSSRSPGAPRRNCWTSAIGASARACASRSSSERALEMSRLPCCNCTCKASIRLRQFSRSTSCWISCCCLASLVVSRVTRKRSAKRCSSFKREDHSSARPSCWLAARPRPSAAARKASSCERVSERSATSLLSADSSSSVSSERCLAAACMSATSSSSTMCNMAPSYRNWLISFLSSLLSSCSSTTPWQARRCSSSVHTSRSCSTSWPWIAPT